MNKRKNMSNRRSRSKGILLTLPPCTYTGNPSFFKCCESRKHDACEAEENGGGVGKAGTPVSERGEDKRRKERHIQCITGNG